MKIHTIIEEGNTIGTVIGAAERRANAWVADTEYLISSIQAQTLHYAYTDKWESGEKRVTSWFVHVITISYQEPTTKNLAASMALVKAMAGL